MTATRSRSRSSAALLVLIGLALVLVAVFTFIKPSGTSLVERFTPNTLGDQPTGAVIMAGEDGTKAVGVAVAPRAHGLLVVATVFGATGRGATGLAPEFSVTGRDGSSSTASATACTAGCYQAVFSGSAMPAHVSVSFKDGSHMRFSLPAHGPTKQALGVVHAAAAEYKQIQSMVTHERLGASPTNVIYTTYYGVRPSSLRFDVRGEGDSIIIGNRRWDRTKGGPWKESPQSPVTPISPYWAPEVQDATILGSTKVQGRPAWVVSFADPQTPGFFTIWVDKKNHRTLKLNMTAAAHFMFHTYDGFNTPLSIRPPKTS